MKKKIVSLEINLNTVKSGRNRANSLKTKPSESPGRKKLRCGDCDQTFLKNCDLEKHIEEHQTVKEHRCNECGKEFFLKWRLNKHIKMHQEKTSVCHYFNNKKYCPYESIGCMFSHELSKTCTSKPCKRKLCPFQHEDQEYECNSCSKQFSCKGDLKQHKESTHTDENDVMNDGIRIEQEEANECPHCNEIFPCQWGCTNL